MPLLVVDSVEEDTLGTIHLVCIRNLLCTQMNHTQEMLSFSLLITEVEKYVWHHKSY